MTIFRELSDLLRMKPEPGEVEFDYAARLALKANKMSNKEWEDTSSEAQLWVNQTLEAWEKMSQEEKDNKTPLPSLDGWGNSGESGSAALSSSEGEGEAGLAEQPQEGEGDMANAKGKKPAPIRSKKVNGSAGRGRPGKFPDEAKIKVLKDNPHRQGSKDFTKFKAIKDGMTMGEARKKGVESGYIRYGIERGIFQIA